MISTRSKRNGYKESFLSIRFFFLAHSFFFAATAFSLSTPTSTISTIGKPSIFSTITNRQIGILDGSELAGLNEFMSGKGKDDNDKDVGEGHLVNNNKNNFGIIRFITGTTTIDGVDRRVIGIESSDSENNSDNLGIPLATIPDKVSDMDAISTAMASIVAVHCCVPTVSQVGGSDDSSGTEFVSGKAVVMGSGEYACYAARAMELLGAEVTLVSTGRPRIKNSKVSVMPPLQGELERGFTDVLGKFDSLLDTLYDENIVDEGQIIQSTVVRELRSKHDCKRYVSTLNKAQSIIRDSGLVFGRNEVKEYQSNIIKSITSSKKSMLQKEVTIPQNFGPMTLQKLLDGGVIYPASKKNDERYLIRGWSLKDFWEFMSWPRDSNGSINSRYGLPVIDEFESVFYNINDSTEEEEPVKEEKPPKVSTNPYVMEVVGVEGLQNDIVSQKRTGVLFLSASFCRTCKTINPSYTRMARMSQKSFTPGDVPLTFAKAETGSKVGKALGRVLGVVSVPTFVLFKDGVRYGDPLSVSKIPSKKLDLAVDYLISGKEWDSEEFEDL